LKRVAEGPMPPDNPIDDALHYIYRVDRPARTSDKKSGTQRR
jgi:aminoglycoside 6'-N-acetyltransferase